PSGSSDKIHYPMNRSHGLARRQSGAGPLAPPEDGDFSSDNALAAFLTFLANDTKVGERPARLYLAHVRRLAGRLLGAYQAPVLDATTRDLRECKAELAARQKLAQPRN